MKRRPSELREVTFDVLVVGAGIHGACIAREAALRGLSVAVVDRYDFGGATSANSQKVIHGGLRYLQKLDLRRVRQSVRERDLLMRLAPHLIAPIPFVIPTFGHGRRSRAGMRAAFGLCNLVAPGDPVPTGRHASEYAKRILSKRELVAI
ncbi:MAG: FAD-dependent oxidoreductase, partial [Planctomycetes bacterium]|nr:FAD-dependent oxidoreductase [Planctomycetota bacterium]